jgi:hypothetical protein
VLEEIAAHLEEAAERERRGGLSAGEAERRAIERVGPVPAVAERCSVTRQRSVAGARERALRALPWLAAVVVFACVSLVSLTAEEPDRHLGIEVVAAVAAALAVLLFDIWDGAARRVSALLAGTAGVWVGASVLLASEGDALFCVLVLAGVLGAAGLLYAGRRLHWRPRRGIS